MQPSEGEAPAAPSRSPQQARRDQGIDGLIAQLCDLIDEVRRHLPEASDGLGWLSIDTACFSLHNAVIALEEFNTEHRNTVPG